MKMATQSYSSEVAEASAASIGQDRAIDISPSRPELVRGNDITTRVVEKTAQHKAERIQALDFTKGALVLLMVLYHWINYFVGPDWEYYKYLRFLTPSFIFVTGFLIARVYLIGYGVTNWRLSKRLFSRGLKLIALFLVLNLAGVALLTKGTAGITLAAQHTVSSIAMALTTGNIYASSGKIVSFYILVPIGYLLILAAGLAFFYRVQKYVFHIVCALCLLAILILYITGLRSDNLEFIAIGLLGVLAGFPTIERINNAVRRPWMMVAAYTSYVIAISVWNVPFPLLVIGAGLSVCSIYLIGLMYADNNKVGSLVNLLGQYSLFAYIAQIAILQLLSAGLRHFNIGTTLLIISFLAAFILTMVVVEIAAWIRKKSAVCDRMYKAVFA